jgi:hypothetical protein
VVEWKLRPHRLAVVVEGDADVMALAACDAVSFQFHHSLWQVETGRATPATDLPSPELVFPLLRDAFAWRGRGVADLVALSGKKGNPTRPHPLPHLRTTAPDPQVAAPSTLTSRYGFSFLPSRNALPLLSLICSLLVFV